MRRGRRRQTSCVLVYWTIKYAAAKNLIRRRLKVLGGVARNRNSKPIIHGILEILFASDVPLGCLHRSVANQKLNLFQFASTAMAKPGACATEIVGRQIVYAGLSGAPLHCVPDYVGCHARFLSHSSLQNPPEYFPLTHSRMLEPDIEKVLAPRRYGYRS